MSKSQLGANELWCNFVIPGLDKVKAEELQKKWAFNKMASDKISLWRSLSDMRSGQCKALTYVLDNLPTSSVVIIFNNGDTRFYSQVSSRAFVF